MRPSSRPLLAALMLPLMIVLAACGEVATSPPGETPAVEPPTPEVTPETSPDMTPDVTPDASPAFPTPGFGTPDAGASPDGGEIEITGLEYRYEGVPATTSVGTSFRLRNDGQELHEIVLIRRNLGVTESFEDLLRMPEEEAMQRITIAGVVMAGPGETSTETVTATEPGDYLMICFVPVGMTELPATDDPNATIPPSPPHFTLGMLDEFTVQ